MLRHLAPLTLLLVLVPATLALGQTRPIGPVNTGPAATERPAPRRSPAEGIRETVAAARYSFIRCAERSARAGETAPGGLAIRIDIEPSGRVREARLRDREHAPRRLAQCIEGVAKRLRFEPQPGAIAIQIPLNVDPSR